MTRLELSYEQDGELFRRFLGVREQVKNGGINLYYALRGMQLVAENSIKIGFLRDMSKEFGWTLEEEGPQHPKGLTVGGLKLQQFLKDGQKYIKGDELRRRAKDSNNANLGQHTVEYLIEHQTDIPAEWRKYILVFPVTVWLDSSFYFRIPQLYWSSGQWQQDFTWLRYGFESDHRLLSLRG